MRAASCVEPPRHRASREWPAQHRLAASPSGTAKAGPVRHEARGRVQPVGRARSCREAGGVTKPSNAIFAKHSRCRSRPRPAARRAGSRRSAGGSRGVRARQIGPASDGNRRPADVDARSTRRGSAAAAMTGVGCPGNTCWSVDRGRAGPHHHRGGVAESRAHARSISTRARSPLVKVVPPRRFVDDHDRLDA